MSLQRLFSKHAGRQKRANSARRCDSRALRLLACAAFVGLLTGCGGDRGPERVVVSGTVTYHGKPLPAGTIRFMPIAAFAVPMAGADIKDGKYTIDNRGGVPVGTHKIEIEAYRVDPKVAKAGEPRPPLARGIPRIQYIPKRYNIDSPLQITIEPGSKKITKDFDLTD